MVSYIFSENICHLPTSKLWKGFSLPPLPEQDAGLTALKGAMMRLSVSGVQVDQCTGLKSKLWCRVTSRGSTSQCFPNSLALTSTLPPLPLYSLKLGMWMWVEGCYRCPIIIITYSWHLEKPQQVSVLSIAHCKKKLL